VGGLQLLAVDEHLQVERDVVAVAGGALDLVDLGEAFAQLVELLVDVLVVDVPLRERHLDAGVVRRVELRTDLHLRGERAAVVLVEGLDVDLGRGDRDDLLGLQCLEEVVVQRVLQRGLGDHPFAEALLQQAAGRLAGTEAGQVDLLGQLPGGGVERLLDAGGFDLDGQLDGDRVDGLDGGLHGSFGPLR
jgi:hypothetical protein